MDVSRLSLLLAIVREDEEATSADFRLAEAIELIADYLAVGAPERTLLLIEGDKGE
jgi:hypothetical protein